MKITTRVYGTLASWMVGGLALILAALYVSTSFLIVLLVFMFSLAAILFHTRCPWCRYPILKRERRTNIGHLAVWVPVVPERCPRCGHQLAGARSTRDRHGRVARGRKNPRPAERGPSK